MKRDLKFAELMAMLNWQNEEDRYHNFYCIYLLSFCSLLFQVSLFSFFVVKNF